MRFKCFLFEHFLLRKSSIIEISSLNCFLNAVSSPNLSNAFVYRPPTWRPLLSTLDPSMVKEACKRCKKPVYPTDKVGPLKQGSYFHHGCFKCYICGTRLSLKTYFHNRKDIEDQEVCVKRLTDDF